MRKKALVYENKGAFRNGEHPCYDVVKLYKPSKFSPAADGRELQ